ncbi:MAG: AAA family ATPase, partial [Chloroflexota bacterium]|nr:AAA family ATPase [Chloroflexota bacterium]
MNSTATSTRTQSAPAPTASPAAPAEPFIVTKEHRLFAEFCDTCRQARYIGICHGPPGVGKTLSGRTYSQGAVGRPPPGFPIFYTPEVANNARQVAKEITRLREAGRYRRWVDHPPEQTPWTWPPADRTELIIVDEADRLKMPGLEQLRDIFDRGGIGLVLIGMPGLEKRLARYAQLYSRVGFVHPFRPLSSEEMHFILKQKWAELGWTLRPDDFADAEAAAAIIRITEGNWRLLQRLWLEIERLMKINSL